MQPLNYIKRGCIFLMVSKMELKVNLKVGLKVLPILPQATDDGDTSFTKTTKYQLP